MRFIQRIDRLAGGLLALLVATSAYAQGPTTFPNKVRIAPTADDALAVGCTGVSPTSCTGGGIFGKISAPGVSGSELITLDGSFGSGTGWTFGSGKWTHGAGFTPLTSTWTPTAAVTYKVVITTVDWTGPAGGITLALGGVTFGAIAENVTASVYYVTAASTAAFTATPTPDTYGTTYNGAISALSITAVTGGTVNAPLGTFSRLALGNGRIFWDATAHETFLGYGAGGSGSYGTALGYNAGNGSTGIQTNFVGLNAGEGSTGHHNNGFGSHALQDSTGLHSNAHGLYALYANTGTYSSAFGDYAGASNTGDYLVAFGRQAGESNSGAGVTVIGDQAGYQNTGVAATAIGTGAGYQNTGGNAVLLGQIAGHQNAGLGLVAIGSFAGYGNQGAGMIAIGYQAGYGATPTNRPVTDTYGILIGYQANRSVASATVLTNYIGIGNGVEVGASNQVVIGNSSITQTKLWGELNIAGVALVGTDGRINGPLSSTIIDNLSGANLTNLNASNVASGTLADARLESTIDIVTALNVPKGTFTAARSDTPGAGGVQLFETAGASFRLNTSNALAIDMYNGATWSERLTLSNGGALAVLADLSVRGASNTTSTPYLFDTSTSAAIAWVRGGEGVSGQINIAGDDGDDNDDIFTIASLGGGDVRFRNGAGSNYLTFSGLTAMSLPSGMTLTIPDLASSLGTRYVCSDVAGTLVDSVSACSGSDAEALASVPKLWQEIYALRAEIAGLLRTGPTAVTTLRPGDVVR